VQEKAENLLIEAVKAFSRPDSVVRRLGRMHKSACRDLPTSRDFSNHGVTQSPGEEEHSTRNNRKKKG
jgi:hypothetical protein